MASVETVTILLTDLVGSTGLESRIGPGAADAVRNEHFALLRAAVEQSGGREIKNTGDGIMVAFKSASHAVSCAVAVQQRAERRNRKSELQLSIKIGLSLGDATVADGDYFGMPAIEAARLCERAQGGQILAKEIVASLAQGRQDTSFTLLGGLELKGLPAPLTAVEVGWEPESPSLSLPPRIREMPPGGFVGRDRERARLAELLDESSTGNRRLALISGEPGIGKTRLSTHTALGARGKGAVVLYGRGDEELAVPYGPWIEALTHYVEQGPESVLRAHVERYGGELSRLVPGLARRLPGVPDPRETDSDTERYLLWGAVVGLLREAAEDEPLVLVLDDLHWTDKPSLLLLKHLVAQGQSVRVLIIATYRESDITQGHPLSDALAELHREQGVERISLKGLDEPSILELMERAAGHDLDADGRDLARELFHETDGNPFYTAELLRHLLESGGIYQEQGRWAIRGRLSELGLPESVREVLGRRVARLGEDVRGVLSMAAVIGCDFDVDLLGRVSDRSDDALLTLLEEAVTASVLIESAIVPGRFSFAHALISHTLYEELGTTRRARLHRRIAEGLEELLGAEPGARVSELAHHWAKATTAVDMPKAASYARLAGERALAELAPHEALRWFSQALELRGDERGGDSGEKGELLIGLGQAQRETGEPAFRETLLEASRIASALGDAELAARASLANNRGIFSVIGEVDRERLQAIERAIELDEPPHPTRRARLLALQAQELGWDPDFARRRALADEAIALARGTGEPRTLAEVLRSAFFACWSARTLELRSALAEELAACASQANDPALQSWAHNIRFQVFTERGELTLAEAELERMKGIAEEVGEPTLKWFATFFAAGWRLMHGDLATGESLAAHAFEIGQEAGEPDAILVYGGQLAQTRLYQGRTEEIIGMIEHSASAYPAVAAWRAGFTYALCAVGRIDEASANLAQAATDRFAHIQPGAAESTALAFYADVAAELGDANVAAILYELIEPLAEQIVWNNVIGRGHSRMWLGLLAGVLGEHELADEHLAYACEFQEANGLLLWTARGQLGWAESLVQRGEAERAQCHAARALELSREHGYGAFEARAAAIVASGAPLSA